MDKLRSALLYGGLILALFFGGRLLLSRFDSPEEKIRRRFEQMTLGFNDEQRGAVLAGFHRDYLDAEGTVDRRRIANALVALFFRSEDLALRMELDSDALTIELEEEGTEGANRAKVDGHLALWRWQADGTEDLYWTTAFRAELVLDSDGWQVLRTSDVDHAGRGR